MPKEPSYRWTLDICASLAAALEEKAAREGLGRQEAIREAIGSWVEEGKG